MKGLLFVCLVCFLLVSCSDSSSDLVVEDVPVVDDGFVVVNDSFDEVSQVVVIDALPDYDLIAEQSAVDIRVGDMKLFGKTFADSEIHEIRLILRDFDSLESLGIRFVPVCVEESSEIIVSINKRVVAQKAPLCGQEMVFAVPLEFLSAGPTTIAIKSKVSEMYAFEDVRVVLVRGGVEEVLEGSSFLLEKGGDDSVLLDTLDGFSVTTRFSRSFHLSELVGDLELSFNAASRSGYVQVLLNGFELFSDSLSGPTQLVLAQELLVVGTNSLVFVVYEG